MALNICAHVDDLLSAPIPPDDLMQGMSGRIGATDGLVYSGVLTGRIQTLTALTG